MDKTKIAVEIFNRRAIDYQAKFLNFDLYNDSFDLFCKHLPKKEARVLDVACGPGNISRYLLKQKPDLKVLGIDLSQNMIELARINNPTAEYKIMDCRMINTLNEKFDGLMCGFCFPYLSKVEVKALIKNAALLLNTGGLLYISTMEDAYANSGFQKSSDGKDEMFIHYHQADYLEEALEKNGFTLVTKQRKNFPDSKIKDLILIATKIKVA